MKILQKKKICWKIAVRKAAHCSLSRTYYLFIYLWVKTCFCASQQGWPCLLKLKIAKTPARGDIQRAAEDSFEYRSDVAFKWIDAFLEVNQQSERSDSKNSLSKASRWPFKGSLRNCRMRRLLQMWHGGIPLQEGYWPAVPVQHRGQSPEAN